MNPNLEIDVEIGESEPDLAELESSFSEMIADGITQKVVRSEKDGFETIVTMHRLDLEPEQSHFVLNIPIHPPLSEIPDVESIVFDDSVRVRITNREKFGARLELVMSESITERKSIFVETVISAATTTKES